MVGIEGKILFFSSRLIILFLLNSTSKLATYRLLINFSSVTAKYSTKFLISDDFILYYDDLQNPSMQKFFLEICQKYKEKDASISTALLAVNGWLGQHESPHINGIITSIDMPKIFPFVNYLG